MKKLLFFAILALSIRGKAQNTQPPIHILYPFTTSIEDVLNRSEDEKTTGTISENHMGQTALMQSVEQLLSIQHYDSIYQWYWDTNYMGWQIDYRFTNMMYDDHNNLTSFILQGWHDTGWENHDQCIFTYDDNNHQTSLTYKIWNGSVWENFYQITNDYDANQNQISILLRIWERGIWEKYSRATFTYDAFNHQTGEVDQSWKEGTWENYTRYSYTYDAVQNQIGELVQSWSGSTWENDDLYTFTYDNGNNQTSALHQYWDGMTWVNYSRNTYTYDAFQNRIVELNQSWNLTEWTNSLQFLFTYDADNNKTSELDQQWSDGTWLNLCQYTYTYDANHFLESYSFRYFDETGTVVMFGDSSYYYSNTVTASIDLPSGDDFITVYPNPTSGRFTISSKNYLSEIEIYNIRGEQVYSAAPGQGQNPYEIDLGEYSKGIYMINMYDGMKMHIRKIVIQ